MFFFPPQIWDNELEMISLGNVLQCIYVGISSCTKTKRYPNTGQMVFTRKDDRSIKLKINESIETWFDGYAMIKDFKWLNPYGSQPRGADLPETFI